MQLPTPRFNEWLVAEKDASEVERKLHRDMLDSAAGGPAPDTDLVLIARAKRAKAQWLFDEAMREMKTLAESLRHRQIDTRTASLNEKGNQQH